MALLAIQYDLWPSSKLQLIPGLAVGIPQDLDDFRLVVRLPVAALLNLEETRGLAIKEEALHRGGGQRPLGVLDQGRKSVKVTCYLTRRRQRDWLPGNVLSVGKQVISVVTAPLSAP